MSKLEDTMHWMTVSDFYEDNDPLVLTDEEQAELGQISVKISSLTAEKLDLLRKFARAKGLTSAKLEDLKSKSGEPYKERDNREKSRLHTSPRSALAKTTEYLTEKRIPVENVEIAYLCTRMYSPEGEINGCGWVKGKPITQDYDDIGPMCGSAGTRFYCKICGILVGEIKTRMS